MTQKPPVNDKLKEANDKIREGFEILRAKHHKLREAYQAQQGLKNQNQLQLKRQRDNYPIRHKSHQTFNKFRTVEHPQLLSQKRRRDNKGKGSTSRKEPSQRYKYSVVPAEPRRVTPDEIGSYKQLKKRKYKPPEVKYEVDAKKRKGKAKSNDRKKSVGKEEEEKEEDNDDDDEDPEATGSVAKNISSRVCVKRILNKLHPTRSLAVGSLKRNVILTHNQAHCVAGSVPSANPIIQDTGPPLNATHTTTIAIDTKRKFEHLSPD
ncbi:hypothetical protein BGZ76_007087, partial [Entomortierella beljakovae]